MSFITPRKPPQIFLPNRNTRPLAISTPPPSTVLESPPVPVDGAPLKGRVGGVKSKVRLVIRSGGDASVPQRLEVIPSSSTIGCAEKIARVTSDISALQITEASPESEGPQLPGTVRGYPDESGALSEGRHLGSHIRFLKTLSQTYENAVSRGLPSFQFFLGGPKVYKRTQIVEADIRAAQILQTEHHLNSYVHLPYIYNLAGSKKHKSLAWVGNQVVDTMMSEILRNIEYELGVMATLSNPESQNGCVIHVGTWDNKSDGIRTIADSLNRIHFPVGSTLLLENSAGSGTTIGKTLDELSQIYTLLNVETKDHVKICLDTQHIFASGQYDLRQYSEIDRLFADIEMRFGIAKLGLVHFNDSKSVFNSQVDNHQLLGQGEIWHQHQSEMYYMLNRIERLKIPALVE